MDINNIKPDNGAVIDIGGSRMRDYVKDRLVEVLKEQFVSGSTTPVLPDELLYDDVGLPIWNKIIFNAAFYQTHDEIALFDQHGAEIAARVQQKGVTLIDPHNLHTHPFFDTKKVGHLLAALSKAKVEAKYLALDISKTSLVQNIGYLVKRFSSDESTITCAGIWGSFEHGMDYLGKIKSPRLFLSLGSVLCNDPWPDALSHLKYWANALRPDDLLLIGMDGHLLPNDREKIWAAYHSCDDLYRGFFLNGFAHANRLIGEEWLKEEDWEFLAELEHEPTTRHRFYFRAKHDIYLNGIDCTIQQGQEFDWFDSHKYGEDSVRLMCYKAGLSIIDVWQAPNSEFRQYLVRRKGDKDQSDDADSAISGLI